LGAAASSPVWPASSDAGPAPSSSAAGADDSAGLGTADAAARPDGASVSAAAASGAVAAAAADGLRRRPRLAGCGSLCADPADDASGDPDAVEGAGATSVTASSASRTTSS